MKAFMNNLCTRAHTTRLINCSGITGLPIRLAINAIKFLMYKITMNKNASGREIPTQKTLTTVTKPGKW